MLQKPAETANKYFVITSFKTTQNQIVEVAERATGQKFEIKKVDAEAWKKEGLEMLQKGDFRAFGRFWGWLLWKDGESLWPGESKFVVGNELLGLPQEDMEEVIKRIAGLWVVE